MKLNLRSGLIHRSGSSTMSNYNEIVAKCLYCGNASAHQTKCLVPRGYHRLDGRRFIERSVVDVLNCKTRVYLQDDKYTFKLKGICPYCQKSLAIFIEMNTIVCNNADPDQYDYEEMSLGYIRSRGEPHDDPMVQAVNIAKHYNREEIWTKLGKCPNCVIIEPECLNGAFVCRDCGWRSI